ncbi:antibiotic biosynthesis monooxygenase [Rhodovarius crocodyli]|uniref:Antibiotic biosynthesis monooxygenase n=1 Tax=Rhodovarius crocodyli TaxID=1979269 RepID=A0A437MPF4_9PROT|nr:putative quinol monooxygenase [Rhodovarius crocodyli]RVT99519.1 antibiotic biosynthesis monooxygenase [Rhodovarius crocodyli]
MPVLVLVELRLKPTKRQEIMASVPAFEAATRQEAGCLAFDVMYSSTDVDLMCSVGRWKDRMSAQAHQEADHTVAMIDVALEHGTDAPRFTVVDVG